MATKNKDTLFIDMKYIILYRKLGFIETEPDVFRFDYGSTSITIESERQFYEFRDRRFPLMNYKDFVILECVDRLLKKGCSPDSIDVCGGAFDVSFPFGDQRIRVYAAQWGKDYKGLCDGYVYDGRGVVCLYTSQLSGGLVDFISRIITPNGTFSSGIFEDDANLRCPHLGNPGSSREYPPEFIVENDELIKYVGHGRDVRIPEGITRIGAGAFWNNLEIETVRIPETVRCICGDAFVYCENLTRINIPRSVVRMGDDPVAGCRDVSIENESPWFVNEGGILFDRDRRTLIHYTASLEATEYRIPETVEWIGKHSFYKCQNLRCVHIPKSVRFMGNNAFSDCVNIRLVNSSPYFSYEDGVLYNRERTTCMHYSMGSGVKEVRLADTVRTIGRNCFWNCAMVEKVVIPASVRQIGYNPFANCRNIVIENHSPYYAERNGILYNSTMEELVCCPPTAAVGDITIPDGVVNIGRNAFTGCINLKSITLPESVRFISRGAFSECTGLEKVELPESVQEVGDWCFNKCTSLRRVTVPYGVELKPNTFNSCGAEVVRR